MGARHGRTFGLVGSFAVFFLTACGGGGGGGGGDNPPNQRPIAQAGSDQVVKRNAAVTLDGTASTDSDGDPLAYRWLQTSGPAVILSSTTSARPTFTAPNQSGPLSFSLVANDGRGDSSPDSVTVTVQNTAPTAASAMTLSVGTGSMATLDGSASSDADGDALTHSWRQLSGPPVTLGVTAPGISQFQAPGAPAVLAFELTVNDGELTSSPVNVTVNVVALPPPNRAPIVNAGEDFETARRAPVTLEGVAVDPDGDSPLTYSWQQVSGPAVTLSDADTLYPTFTAPETPALLRFAFRARDGADASAADEVEVNVRNYAPEVINAAITPDAPYTDDTLLADALTYDADEDPINLRYEWRRNGALVDSQTSNSFPASLTTKNDVITVRITADDGLDPTTVDASTTILDSPAVLSLQVPAPTELDYGDTARFVVTATDADGDVVPGFEVAFGPAGFNVTNQGVVTWTAAGPLFDRVTDFNWGIRLSGEGSSSLVSGTFTVTDVARVYPLRRTGVTIPVQHNGLRIADLDGDGDSEMLVGSSRAVYVLSRSGAGYQQSWMYPFDVRGDGDYYDEVSAIETADLDGDGRQEIFFAKGSQLLRLDGAARREAVRRPLRCRDLESGDLDGNGSLELVCLATTGSDSFGTTRIAVLNPATLAEIWSTPELPADGTVALGNVDADAALEIVTSAGYVFDGQTRQNQWAYSEPFGVAVDTGDMNGDGVEEIIGIKDWTSVRAFSAVNRSPLWEFVPQNSTDFDALAIADADGDGRIEAIVGNGQWGEVMGISYNSTASRAELVWQISSQEHGVTSIAVGDVDADGESEVVWGTGATSSGADDFVIAGFAPTLKVKWQSSQGPQLDGPFHGGALARIGGGASRLMFVTPRTDSGYGGLRAIGLNPMTTQLEISTEIGTNWGQASGVDVADYDNDGVDELFIGSASTYDGFFAAYDFAAAVLEWQSPVSPSNTARAVAHADMNGDGHADLVGLSNTGYIDVHDVHGESLLWRSTRLGSGVDLALADLDDDGEPEIIVALSDRIVIYAQALVGSTYLERASVPLAGTVDLLTADLNGDDELEIYALHSGPFAGNATLSVLDDQLQPVRSVPLGTPASGIFIEESSFARKNLVLAAGGSALAGSRPELWAIDPVTGADVWRSPPIVGNVQRNSLYFVDVDGDGDQEISFGTAGGMYHTR